MDLTRRKLVALVAIGFLLGASPAVGTLISNMVHTPSGVSVRATDGPEATVYADRVDLQQFQPDNNTLHLETSNGNITLSAQGHANVTVDEINGTWTNTSALNATTFDLTIAPDDKQNVTVAGDTSTLKFTSMTLDDASTDFIYAGASGNTTLTVTGLPASTEIAAVDRNTHEVLAVATTDASGTATFSGMPNSEHSVELQTSDGDPVINDGSPSDNETISTSSPTLTVNVSDPDLPDDELDVDFYLDGSKVGTKTVTSNGTVSIDVTVDTGGHHTWTANVTDSYGQSNESTFDFRAPSELRIYHETHPTKLINDSNLSLTVRFYPLDDGSSTKVVTRNATNGTVDLSGLDVNTRFVVTAKTNNSSRYTYRRIVIDSLYQTQRIYLLNESEPHSQVVFNLQDPTGQFPPEDTILYIEKPIKVNGTTEYQTIAGDTFGSTGRFPAVLQEDSRYRLRVETANGTDSRILGSYSVYEPTVEPLKIQRIKPQSNVDAGSTVYGSLETYNGTTSVAVRFQDFANNSTSVTYQVRNGDTVIIENTSTTADSFAHIYQVGPNNSTYTIEYWIEHPDGTVTHDTYVVGEVPSIAERFNIDPQVMSIASWIMILATMGLIVIVDSKFAPLGGTGMASALVIVGTVAIPMPILGVAGAISVLTLFGGGR